MATPSEHVDGKKMKKPAKTLRKFGGKSSTKPAKRHREDSSSEEDEVDAECAISGTSSTTDVHSKRKNDAIFNQEMHEVNEDMEGVCGDSSSDDTDMIDAAVAPEMSNVSDTEWLEGESDDGGKTLLPRAPSAFFTIKNKQRRKEAYIKLMKEKRKSKIERRKLRDKMEKELGDKAPPRQQTRTIENTREPDPTMVQDGDEEVMYDEQTDEVSSYYRRETTPKILITTSDRPHRKTNKFVKELQSVIPNSKSYYRRGLDLKKIIPQMAARDYTDLIVVNHDKDRPNGMLISHLPDGPTAHFKINSMKYADKIRNRATPSDHHPEVVLNNFKTRLGHGVARLLAALFPHDPQFSGRRVVTFHNQRDYIFFRHHRYQFKDGKKCRLQEIGPRFTLRLRSLQNGTFNSKFGEYEWIKKRHEMETSRRRFFL